MSFDHHFQGIGEDQNQKVARMSIRDKLYCAKLKIMIACFLKKKLKKEHGIEIKT